MIRTFLLRPRPSDAGTNVRGVAVALSLLCAGAFACGGASGPKVAAPNAAATTAERRPYKLVVSIVVDQLSAWEMRARLPLLPATGGFARLAKEGVYYTSVLYPHLTTDTAPGHAALYTGVPSGKSGVYANEAVLPSGATGSIYRDEAVHVVGNTTADTSSSAKRLRVPTVADLFRKAHPDSKIVSLSLKDRGAIPGGGAKPTLSLWFDVKSARMVTSTAFAQALPPWLDGGKNAIDRELYGQPWTMANEEWVKTHAVTKDGAPGEGNMAGLGTTFPHPVTSGEHFGLAFRTTPAADAYLLSLARDAIDHERLGEGPSFLAISLSTHDYIGHVFGPDAWEAWDELYRLDAELGKFLAFLDARFGSENYAVMLSADHGITSLPELRITRTAEVSCSDDASCDALRTEASTTRLYPEELRDSLETALHTVLATEEKLVLGLAEPYVVLTPKGKSMVAVPQNDVLVDRALAQWRLAHKDQASLEPVARTLAACALTNMNGQADWAALCATLDSAGGDFFLRTHGGAIVETGYVPGFGTNHGTDSFFDREVPIFARAPKSWDGGKKSAKTQPISIFARDLKTLLGL